MSSKDTGFLIEPENIDQLTAACEKLLQNPELRTKLGQNGRAAVTQQFAPETMVDTIETVYKNLIKTS